MNVKWKRRLSGKSAGAANEKTRSVVRRSGRHARNVKKDDEKRKRIVARKTGSVSNGRKKRTERSGVNERRRKKQNEQPVSRGFAKKTVRGNANLRKNVRANASGIVTVTVTVTATVTGAGTTAATTDGTVGHEAEPQIVAGIVPEIVTTTETRRGEEHEQDPLMSTRMPNLKTSKSKLTMIWHSRRCYKRLRK